jgi:DNA-binding CsgD family transcriptional regulator
MIHKLNKETLIKLYLIEGKSTTEIARIFGRAHSTIWYKCKKYRIKLRHRGRTRIELKKSVLERLYVKEKKSLTEIGEVLSCSLVTIRNRCEEYGIKLRRVERVKGLNEALLHKLYFAESKTILDIAKIVGCSREQVRRRCKKYGIPLRSPGCRGTRKKKQVE